MELTVNILLDRLQRFPLEAHIVQNDHHSFIRPAMLPRDYTLMREDQIHICRLSDALRASAQREGMYYICVRDRIKDAEETDERLTGMIVINENIEVECLLNSIYEVFRQINEWHRAMLEGIIREKSLDDILALSEPVLGNTINISDSAFMLLARTNRIETDDPISLGLIENGYHPESTLQLFRKAKRFAVWEKTNGIIVNQERNLGPYVLVNKIFHFQNTYFTHVVMVCDHHPLNDGLLELFQLLTEIIAIYAERNWKNKNALSHNYDSFLTDLISGTLTAKEDIEARAQYLGLRTGDRMALLKITLGDGAETALGRIGHELTGLLPSVEAVLYDHALVALVHFLSVTDSLEARGDDLRVFLSRHHAAAAVSSVYRGLENTPAAYHQASLAMKYRKEREKGRLEALFSPIPAAEEPVTFHSQVLYSLLGEAPREAEIWRYSSYYKALREIHQGDELHDTNNLQLLRAYLWNERRATETGQKLHMHRNNVIYRIGRIQTMIGMDLSDHDTRMGLEMSFLLLEIFGFDKTEDAI